MEGPINSLETDIAQAIIDEPKLATENYEKVLILDKENKQALKLLEVLRGKD